MPPTPPRSRYDVFLSHQSGDKPQVERLAARLEDEAKIKPFLDKWHLVPGQPWQEELESALDQSATCAVFLGASGLGAWENEEMRSALDDRVRSRNFRVIPVLLPGANPQLPETLPRFLRRLTWVDFRAGIEDAEAFQRLVAGIRGTAPGRQATAQVSAVTARSQSQWKERLVALFTTKGELWKVILGAVIALVFSTAFISAAIPRYKLQVKSPAFRKDGIYEVPAGVVLIKWSLTKGQWFRETDVSDGKAALTINKTSGETVASLPEQPGEAKVNLQVGKYEARIDAAAYGRTETIALQVTSPNGATETATLSGTVFEKIGGKEQPLQGAKVTIEQLPQMTPVETATDGHFTIDEIPKAYHERVRVHVSKEGYLPPEHIEDFVIGATPPRITLTRKK